MQNDTILYLISPQRRPPCYFLSDYLWGINANIDSDGNSRWPDDTEWAELSLILRDGEEDVQVHVDPVSTDPLILQIRSPNADLAKRTATYLSEQVDGRLIHPDRFFQYRGQPMLSAPPRLFAIDRDDYHAEHVGRTPAGQQFFLTTPFEPAAGSAAGCEFVALYLFDQQGLLIDAKIDSVGPRAAMNDEARKSLYAQRLAELGQVSFRRIEIAPFSVERFGTTFGLVLREPDEDVADWTVEAEPGDYMAFFAPWDSGEYDT